MNNNDNIESNEDGTKKIGIELRMTNESHEVYKSIMDEETHEKDVFKTSFVSALQAASENGMPVDIKTIRCNRSRLAIIASPVMIAMVIETRLVDGSVGLAGCGIAQLDEHGDHDVLVADDNKQAVLQFCFPSFFGMPLASSIIDSITTHAKIGLERLSKTFYAQNMAAKEEPPVAEGDGNLQGCDTGGGCCGSEHVEPGPDNVVGFNNEAPEPVAAQ